MYDLTQQSLRDMGIGPDDEVTLYRGMKRTTLSAERNKVSVSEKYANGNYKYTGNPIESWTLSMHEARKFGSHQAGMTVKASNIFSTPYSGLGCWGEEEFVIFGSVPGYVATIYS